jgi:hypothetical protein
MPMTMTSMATKPYDRSMRASMPMVLADSSCWISTDSTAMTAASAKMRRWWAIARMRSVHMGHSAANNNVSMTP